MGAVTTPDNLPYPEDADPPDVPSDFQALAGAVQSALVARDTAIDEVQQRSDNRIIYGQATLVPQTLEPGQVFLGY